MTIENLEKELKQGKLNSIYLLYGEELFLLENALKKIKANFGQLVNGINYINIDEQNIDNLIQDMQTPAFGFEKKLIVVRNSKLFKKEIKKKNVKIEELKTKLNDYIKKNKEEIEDSLVIVFIEEDIGKETLVKTIEEIGVVCNFEKQKLPQISKRLKAICNAYKVQIDEDTMRYFVECCGTSMQDLINEIRKLIEYEKEGGTITKQSIDLLSIKQIDSVIFDLTDSLGKKDIKQAIEVLNNLLYAKEPIQKILITLYNHFKKLYIVTLAKKYNRNIAESLNLKPNQMFLTTKYQAQAKYFKENELKSILEEMIKLDSSYKNGLIDLNVGLEAILCKYCS